MKDKIWNDNDVMEMMKISDLQKDKSYFQIIQEYKKIKYETKN